MNAKPEWWTSDEWSTPPEFAARMAELYGPFDLDACCRPETAKAPEFYTKADNGLEQPWFGKVWINPPYSDPKPWCLRAAEQTTLNPGLTVVMLLPAAVDTKWFHEWVVPYADVVFIRGRLKFIGWQGTPTGSPKAGNVLAIYPKQTDVALAPSLPAVA